jgi:DNA-binding FrmR family transcriptional regulator
MSHIAHNSKNIVTRLHRIKGQADAMENGLGQGMGCAALLHQIASMRGAIDGLLSEVLEGHIREHLGDISARPEQRKQDLDNVIGVLKSYLK